MYYFKEHPFVDVKLVVCNKPGAAVIDKTIQHGVAVQLVNRQEWNDSAYMLNLLDSYKVDLIVLAGFLWLIPLFLVAHYPKRIMNIHPALLPKYGGKGMYGSKVHEAVKQAAEPATGITIHYVNEKYDEGEVIFQQSCPIDAEKQSAEEIAQCVHELEYRYFPKVVEQEAQRLLAERQKP